MNNRNSWLKAFAVVSILLLSCGRAAAAELRFHYVPVDSCGNTALKPACPCGAVGERVSWFGTVHEQYSNQPRPTHLVTFRHPYTVRNVTVAMTFPVGTPRVEVLPSRVVYHYGSYSVEARFVRDGSVDVVYNSGLLRAP